MRLSDKQLVTISLFVSGSGLLGLVLVFALTTVPLTSFQDAQDLPDGDEVRVQGRILTVNQRGNTTFLVLEQSCSIDAVIFDVVNLQEGSLVSLTGSISTYATQREVLVDEISLIS